VSRVALLDVKLLVALFDPDHVHHEAAHGWFAGARSGGWATCPLTENGLLTDPVQHGLFRGSRDAGGGSAASERVLRERTARLLARRGLAA